MKILVIEDDQNKLTQIRLFFKQNYPDFIFHEKKSYNSGLKELIRDSYDLLILDMTLPTFEKSSIEPGGRLRYFAGKEILVQLDRRKIDVPVIVFTQFDKFGEENELMTLKELKEQMDRDFKSNYKNTVFYDSTSDLWQKSLEIEINNIIGNINV